MRWYDGPTLLEHLESLDVEQGLDDKPFRFPVQWVNRPNLDFRGFSGTVASGIVRAGDRVVVAASGKESTVARIVTADGDLPEARAGDAVTLTLGRRSRCGARRRASRRADSRPEVVDQFAAHVLWMAEERDASRALVPDAHRHEVRSGARHQPQAQGRRQHPGAHRREDAGAERDRSVQSVDRGAGGVRSLRGEPRRPARSS